MESKLQLNVLYSQRMAAALFQNIYLRNRLFMTSRADDRIIFKEIYVQTLDAHHFNFQCANLDTSWLSSMKESKREVQSVYGEKWSFRHLCITNATLCDVHGVGQTMKFS